ncbi:MAG: phosphatase PAP2 family protein [Candidatus Marinimicrobia bacterium]|nr:phosphatase PAP2 family protein [Candidatus Neomarinimicrobiota bacterium]
MIAISDPYRWIFPTLTFAMIIIYLNWKSGLTALLLGGVSALIADRINAKLFKMNTDRIRPGKLYPDIRSLGIMNKGKKSFPSNHASNTMAIAIGYGLLFSWTAWILIPFSLIVGYSRIYCGAHFPLDVLGGWLHGSIWVIVLFSLIRMW